MLIATAGVFAARRVLVSCPPYGMPSRNETIQLYININSTDYQNGSVYNQWFSDGSCGEYGPTITTDYLSYGTYIAYWPYSSHNIYYGDYVVGTSEGYNYYADGYAGYYSTDYNVSYYPQGTVLASTITGYFQTEVPSGSGYYVNNGNYDETFVKSNGSGGIYNETLGGGGPYPDGTVIYTYNSYPTGVYIDGQFFANGITNYDNYVWNGSGGYYTSSGMYGSYYSYGTQFYYNNNVYYYWDGNGGYYTYYFGGYGDGGY